ncbi:MAG: hypothetical protein C4293_00840 [Nitrospiraceae bacterium]
MVLVSAGCAAATSDVSHLPGLISQRQAEEVIRTTRAEAAALRAEVAAAKKEAELQELRRQIAELRQTTSAKQTELAALRAERDQLLQTKAEVQVQLAELPLLRQTTVEAKSVNIDLQRRMQELESALASLSADLEQVKKDLAEARSVFAPKKKATTASPPRSSTTLSSSKAKARMKVNSDGVKK